MNTFPPRRDVTWQEESPKNPPARTRKARASMQQKGSAPLRVVGTALDNDPQNEFPVERSEPVQAHTFEQSPHYDKRRHKKAPNGYWAGRPIIKNNGPINGGVFISENCRHEAIVVDEHYGLLEHCFTELLARLVQRGLLKIDHESGIISEVIETVCQLLHYAPTAVGELLHGEGIQPNQRLALDVFIRKGLGASRHQVILAAYLLEKLKQKGVLGGHCFIEIKLDDNDSPHVQLTYASRRGDLIIFSPFHYHGRASQGQLSF